MNILILGEGRISCSYRVYAPYPGTHDFPLRIPSFAPSISPWLAPALIMIKNHESLAKLYPQVSATIDFCMFNYYILKYYRFRLVMVNNGYWRWISWLIIAITWWVAASVHWYHLCEPTLASFSPSPLIIDHGCYEQLDISRVRSQPLPALSKYLPSMSHQPPSAELQKSSWLTTSAEARYPWAIDDW